MLEVSHITKFFVNSSTGERVTILDDVSLKIESGEFFTILGPSGCGKTTFLRILAGLESANSGRIFFGGRDLTQLPPQSRPFHMVFQKHALFPHMSVFDNVAFGLRLRQMEQAEVQDRVSKVLALVKLIGFENRMPETLSGGQSQRVALARALVNEPKVLLLDEPLSALDARLRDEMQAELRMLQRQLGIIFIYITHDQQEAFSMSDRIGIMNGGQFEQVSAPEDLYDHPASLFSAQFVGSMISLPIFGDVETVRGAYEFTSSGQVLRATRVVGPDSGVRVFALVRPERVSLVLEQRQTEENEVSGTVLQITFRGPYTEVRVQIGPDLWIPVLLDDKRSHELELYVGQSVLVYFRPEDTVIFRSVGASST